MSQMQEYEKKISRRVKFFLLSWMPLYFIAVGFMLQPAAEVGEGLARIIREPDFLITDYFVIGGPGAALVNGGIIWLVSLLLIYLLGREMEGHAFTSGMLMFGFALFGKNLLNIWPILAGVFLYAKYHKASPADYIYTGLYGTSLSPIITQVMMIEQLPMGARMIITCVTGLVIGFVLPPLATWAHFAHRGYSLYNVGFAAGIVATVVVSMFKSLGLEVQSRLLWYSGENGILLAILLLPCLGLIVAGVAKSGSMPCGAILEF